MEKFELELTEENIAKTIKDDLINNNKKLFSLIDLVSNIEDNMIVCIDGERGSGKTFLVSQFKYLVDKNDYSEFSLKDITKENLEKIRSNNVVVYYDAWKNDSHKDAFQSIIYNILNEFSKYKKIVPKHNTIRNFISDAFLNFFEKSTFDIINFDKITTFEDLAEQIVTEEEKKEKFKELINKIFGEKRLILIIDEIDRCNPLYATKILETVKHFYDLENITVIVVANNKELVNTIKKQYGYNFDAYAYLNKFYDFIITLDNKNNINYSKKYLEFSERTYLPHNVAFVMFKKYNFSYRECNRYKTMYNMVKKYIEADKSKQFNESEYTIAYSILLPIILALKIKDIEKYTNVLNGDERIIKEMIEYLIDEFKNDKEIGDNWIAEITQREEGKEIQYVLQVYKKYINIETYNDCIRMTISD